MKHPKLKVEKRKVLGKKIKKLRREGILPANIYGKNIKSVAIQVSYKDFEKIYKETGVTGLVDVELDGKSIPALIHNIHQDYRHNVLHADFFQVNLKEKVKATVPLLIEGEPVAVKEKLGMLMEILHEVEVEALPEALPENIKVNTDKLAAVNEQITVADLKAPEGVAIQTDPAQVVVKIGELVSKETQEEIAQEEAAAAEAEETKEAGEQPKEETATTEEEKTDTKPQEAAE